MRRFNTAGPCEPTIHYMVPAEPRLPEARGLIAQGAYFVVHAPRQTGKTTTLRALARALTAEGRYAALHFTCEIGKVFATDVGAAEDVILSSLQHSATTWLPPDLQPPPMTSDKPGSIVLQNLAAWARACPRPLVLFFDEIDALRDDALVAVLGQLRGGAADRPRGFPASIVLCGLRDVRDYKAASGGDPSRLGTSSPFNIKLESLRLGDLTPDEVCALYRQHMDETGQPFEEAAIERAFALTQGQPWLVNALGREVTEKMDLPALTPITVAHIEEAKERLILARATHLDSLVARLYETRVHRVIEPIIAGELIGPDPTYDDDMVYVRDLGLVARDKPARVANPIYREVIVRVLGAAIEDNISAEPRTFVQPDGRLDLRRLLEEFLAFWREHGEVLAGRLTYHEAAAQLVLMAFLQRIVNGGGYVDREYGVGRGRIDLLVRWPYRAADGTRAWQREPFEIKVWRPGRPDPLAQGLAQLDAYVERLGLDHGVLALFDRRPEAPPIADRTRLEDTRSPAGRSVVLLRG
jgi:hypothetical protein